MTSQDNIIGGLRNALERGEDLKSAGNTFVNAGYDKSDVRAAMQTFKKSLIKKDKINPLLNVKAMEEVKPIVFKPVKKETPQKEPFLKTKAAIITGIVGVIFIIILLMIWLFNVFF